MTTLSLFSTCGKLWDKKKYLHAYSCMHNHIYYVFILERNEPKEQEAEET